MSIKVHIPAPWRPFVAGRSLVEIQAATLAELMEGLEAFNRRLKRHVLNGKGGILPHVHILRNGKAVNSGLATLLKEGDEVFFLPALAGGEAESPAREKEGAGRERKPLDLKALKAGGFIKQKQAGLFALRLKVPLGNLTGAQLMKVAEVARRYGRDSIHLTLRQGIEIPFLRLDDFNEARAELATAGLGLGACGARVRVVTACQGTAVCSDALGDTHLLAGKLDEMFYGRWGLPHKFKMGVTGCPNACAKPQENDLGFMAVAEPILDEREGQGCISCGICANLCPEKAIRLVEGKPVVDLARCSHDGRCILNCPTGALQAGREGWNAYAGGKWGRAPQLGVLFAEFLSLEEAVNLAERILVAYGRLARPGERLGGLINRLGRSKLEEEVAGENGSSPNPEFIRATLLPPK